jgi:hypothetical protein
LNGERYGVLNGHSERSGVLCGNHVYIVRRTTNTENENENIIDERICR